MDEKLKVFLASIPNLPNDDVKIGKNDTENDVIKTVGGKPSFNFKPLDHVALGEKLDIIDIDNPHIIDIALF